MKIDAPLSMALNANDAACKIFVYEWPGRISNCGIENLLLESDYDSTNLKDEDHCWTAVSVENASGLLDQADSFQEFCGKCRNSSANSVQNNGRRLYCNQSCFRNRGMRRNTFHDGATPIFFNGVIPKRFTILCRFLRAPVPMPLCNAKP